MADGFVEVECQPVHNCLSFVRVFLNFLVIFVTKLNSSLLFFICDELVSLYLVVWVFLVLFPRFIQLL